MITREALSSYLETYLQCSRIQDYAPNGLQVEGRSSIKKIFTAVTANLNSIQIAIQSNADALIVHHGYFWKGEPSVVTGMKRARLQALLNADLNLFAYHLPLDIHLELGNNAMIGQLLELNNIQSLQIGAVPNLLWMGTFSHPIAPKELSTFLEKKFNRLPLMVQPHAKPIQTIAWCSGGAQDYLSEAHRLGADAYLSGEIAERTYYESQELGIHYFAAGHHATERLGIQALGQHLSSKFDLEHIFIDSNNPI